MGVDELEVSPGTVGTACCFGDGSGTPCPCGNEAGPCANEAGPGEGCGDSTGAGFDLTNRVAVLLTP